MVRHFCTLAAQQPSPSGLVFALLVSVSRGLPLCVPCQQQIVRSCATRVSRCVTGKTSRSSYFCCPGKNTSFQRNPVNEAFFTPAASLTCSKDAFLLTNYRLPRLKIMVTGVSYVGGRAGRSARQAHRHHRDFADSNRQSRRVGQSASVRIQETAVSRSWNESVQGLALSPGSSVKRQRALAEPPAGRRSTRCAR